MAEQDRSMWDRSLIQKGIANLELSAASDHLSMYSILAMISAYHCSAPDFESTDWKSILSLYDNLLRINNSPVVLLNRTIALSKVSGPEEALVALEQIKKIASIQSYYLLYSAEAELLMQLNRYKDAALSLHTAIQLAALPAEKDLLKKRLDACSKKIS